MPPLVAQMGGVGYPCHAALQQKNNALTPQKKLKKLKKSFKYWELYMKHTLSYIPTTKNKEL